MQDHAHVLAQDRQRILAIIHAINAHRALRHLVETWDQFDQRCFAAARETDQGDLATNREIKVNAFEHRPFRYIIENHVIKNDIPAQAGRAMIGRLAFQHFGSLIQHLLNAFRARSGSAGERSQL